MNFTVFDYIKIFAALREQVKCFAIGVISDHQRSGVVNFHLVCFLFVYVAFTDVLWFDFYVESSREPVDRPGTSRGNRPISASRQRPASANRRRPGTARQRPGTTSGERPGSSGVTRPPSAMGKWVDKVNSLVNCSQ